MRGPWNIPCLTGCSLRAAKIVKVLLLRPRATWNEVGLYLCWKRTCGSHTTECVAEAMVAVFCHCCGGKLSGQLGEDEVVVVIFDVVCAASMVMDFGGVRVFVRVLLVWLSLSL